MNSKSSVLDNYKMGITEAKYIFDDEITVADFGKSDLLDRCMSIPAAYGFLFPFSFQQ